MSNRFGFPYLGFGLGLRQPHYAQILAERPKSVEWFEVISENFLETHEGYRGFLHELRNDYPIVLHGVSLSLGTTDPLNREYLAKLRTLADELRTPWVSDHLCWTGVAHTNTHDLLPVPYTHEALRHCTDRIKQVQDALGRPFVMENPSSYVTFRDSDMPEWEFIARLAEEADCGLLLDVNNVWVSAFNHRFDPERYIDAIPADRVVQIHLAGHTHMGSHIVDTHDADVIEEVWNLYARTIRTIGPVTTMIERDGNIPAFEELVTELNQARKTAEDALKEREAA